MYFGYRFIKQILFTLLFIFLLVDAIYLYSLNDKINTNAQMQKWNVELILLNKKIDQVFNYKLKKYDYDKLDIDIERFKYILKRIKNNKNLNDFFSYQSNVETLSNIEDKFENKEKIIYGFKADNVNSLVFLDNLDKIHKKIVASGDFQNTKSILLINGYMYRLNMQNNHNYDEVRKINRKLLRSATNAEAYSYFVEIEKILIFVSKMRESTIENSYIRLGIDLHNLSENFEKYMNDIINSLYINIILFLVAIVFFVIAISFLLSSMQTKTKTMMQFQQAVQNSDNVVVITDVKHHIKYVNDAFEKTTGYSSKEVLGQTPAILQSGLHDRNFYDEINARISSGKTWIGEFSNRRKDGQIIYEKTSIYPMLDDYGKLDGYLGIKLNITDEKSYLQEIEKKGMEVLSKYQIDDATGLWSKNVLEDELARNTVGFLIYIKIKNFKDLSFFYGTKTANKIIKNIASKLKRFIYIYKIGGQPFIISEDVFCIWYKQKRPPIDLLDAINLYFAAPVEIEGTLQPIDISMGVSTDRNLLQGDRLWQSMIAFYKAEQMNMPYMYYEASNELEKEYRENLITARRIKNALNSEQVMVECQPIFDTKTKEIYSYEVLMRLADETGKKMYPNEFLNIAKQSLLYSPLMQNVIYLTFELMKSYPDTKFSINMSSVDMLDEDTSRIFLNLLESSDHPENVIIEILESEGVSDYDTIKPFLKRAKNLGCQLSIDDFGSGYSNYYRIMELDIDNIKIDGSIIKRLSDDENSRIVVETIVEFAKRKGYKIVAEFVSNEEIYNEVKKYGIDYTQGFYLGKPIELPLA